MTSIRTTRSVPRSQPSASPSREVITAGSLRTELDHSSGGGIDVPALTELGTARLVCFDVRDERIAPENYAKADGAPLRILNSPAAKVDVSKRSHEDMGFWHRSVDHSEVIICVQGALRWETELGTHILRPGHVLVIPRGIAHRSALCEESEAQNILIEVKVAGDLDYTGPAKVHE